MNNWSEFNQTELIKMWKKNIGKSFLILCYQKV